jgi:hypothetical protein
MNFPLMAAEHPLFPQDSLPPIPEGFEATSWCNDVCPSFVDDARGMSIYIDYPYPQVDGPEVPQPSRFTLTFMVWGGSRGWSEPDEDTDFIDSGDWSVVLAAIEEHADHALKSKAAALAKAFVAVLKEWLSPEDFADMRVRNVGSDDRTCASHDFCDANIAMLEAFEATMDAEPKFLEGTDAEGNFKAEQDAEMALWNLAWSLAKPALTETTKALTAEFAAWTDMQDGLGQGDAMEMLMGPLTDEQRDWLTYFSERWDAVQQFEDAKATA